MVFFYGDEKKNVRKIWKKKCVIPGILGGISFKTSMVFRYIFFGEKKYMVAGNQ
jgi:hypothetical protein